MNEKGRVMEGKCFCAIGWFASEALMKLQCTTIGNKTEWYDLRLKGHAMVWFTKDRTPNKLLQNAPYDTDIKLC